MKFKNLDRILHWKRVLSDWARVTATGAAMSGGLLLGSSLVCNSANAGIFDGWGHGAQCFPCPVEEVPTTDGEIPETPPTEEMGEDLPEVADLTSDAAFASSDQSVAVAMIGDSIFGGFGVVMGCVVGVTGATLSIAGGDKRFKIADNFSPIPQNRVYVTYNHYENALSDANLVETNLDRYNFGFERTFFCNMASVELRVPYVDGLNSTQVVSVAPVDNTGGEFGDVKVIFKGVVYQDCCTTISAGIGIGLPTADDAVVLNTVDLTTQVIRNESVHLQPYVGAFRQMGRAFTIGFAQMDIDANGILIESTDTLPVPGFDRQRVYDQTLLYLDGSLGYWLYESCCPCDTLSAVAGMLELHYTTTVEDSDTFDADPINVANRMDILNLTAGVKFYTCNNTVLTVGAGAPLRDDEEHLFDTEIQVYLTKRF